MDMKFVQNSSNVATNVFIFKAVKLEPLHPGFNAKATLPSSSSLCLTNTTISAH